MGLRDLIQGGESAIDGALSGVGSFVQNDLVHPVEQAFTPQAQPQPPQPSPFSAPPIQNFTDWMGSQAHNAGNALSGAFNDANQLFQTNPNVRLAEAAPGFVKNTFFPPQAGPGQVAPQTSLGTRILNNLPQVPNPTQAINAIPNINIPKPFNTGVAPVDFVGNLPSNIAEGTLNAPKQSFQSAADFGNRINAGTLTPESAISDVAGAAMLPLTIATGGGAGGLLKGGIKIGLPSVAQVGKGIAIGSGVGAGFGGLSGLSQAGNTTNMQDLAGYAGQGALQGALGGAVMGGVAPFVHIGGKPITEGATPFLTKLGNHLVNITKDMFLDPGFQNSIKGEQGFFSIDSPAVKMTPIDNLVSHEGAPDQAQVNKYRNELSSGTPVQPLYVIKEGNKLGVIDGQHRLQAAKDLGYSYVPTIELKPEPKQNVMSWFNNERGSIKLDAKLGNPLPKNRPIDRTQLTGKQLDTSTEDLLKAGQQDDPFIAGLKADQAGEAVPPVKNPEAVRELEENNLPKEKPAPPERSNPDQNPVNPKDVRSARAKMDTAITQIQQRAGVLKRLVDIGVSKSGKPKEGESPTNFGENKLFRQAIEHPDQEQAIYKQVKNPAKFSKAVQAFRDFTDFTYNLAKSEGSQVGFLKGYYSHILDLSSPEDQARFDSFLDAKAKNYKGWFNKKRIFANIEELEGAGFHLKNANVVDDLVEYANAFSKEQGARVLTNALVKNLPAHAIDTQGQAAAPSGMTQSRIPGTKGLFVTPELQSKLADLEPSPESTAGKVVIGGVNALKQSTLGGGLFHIQNTGWDYLASNAGFGRFPRVWKAVSVFLSPGEYSGYMQDAIKDGTLDKMAQSNVTFGSQQDFMGQGKSALQRTTKGISKVNPVSMLNRATFQRLENFFKVEAFRALDSRGLIKTDTPQHLEEARAYGRQINNTFGGQNRIVGDDIFNKSSRGNMLAHLAILAPDYQQGRFKRTFAAIQPLGRSGANNYAAYTLALRIIMTAAVAELLRRAVSGKASPNLISVIQNDLLDPNFPTPWKNTSAKGTQTSQVAHLPATNINDIARLISDPGHFLISHASSGLSGLSSFMSNTDYFGNKLSQTNSSGEKLLKIAENDLPIPVVQARKVAGGEAQGNALLNELGARVATDPNDPSSLYFNARDKALQALDPKIQGAYGALQAVSTLSPDDPRRKQVEYTSYLAFPQLFQVNAQAQLAQAGGDPTKVDPLFTSSVAPQYMEYEQLSSTYPGGTAEKDFLKLNPQVSQLIQARSAFFQANPLPNTSTSSTSSAPLPSAYVQQQLNAKNYNDPQVQSYFAAHNQYINGQRSQLMLPMLNTFGQDPIQAAAYSATSNKNSMMSAMRKAKYIKKEAAYVGKKIKQKSSKTFSIVASKGAKPPYKSKNYNLMGLPSARIGNPQPQPLQKGGYKIVPPPTLKKAGYKAAFKVPPNMQFSWHLRQIRICLKKQPTSHHTSGFPLWRPLFLWVKYMSSLTLNEQQILLQIHVRYEGSVASAPATTDDDYLVRRTLANEAIARWSNAEGTLWNELWTPSAGASGAALTVTSNTTTYALPSNFVYLGGYVRLIDSNGNPTYYKKVKQYIQDLHDADTPGLVYVTGSSNGGYFLNFFPGINNTFPATGDIGKTIKYEYYKTPNYLSTPTDTPDMADPWFIVHYVLSVLHAQDSNYDQSDKEWAIAEGLLKEMQTKNMMSSWMEDDRLNDQQFVFENTGGFGS